MNDEDPLFDALSKLPMPPVDPALSRTLQGLAHAELAQGRAGRRRGAWLDLLLAAVACAVAVLHTGWAVSFVSGLYR